MTRPPSLATLRKEARRVFAEAIVGISCYDGGVFVEVFGGPLIKVERFPGDRAFLLAGLRALPSAPKPKKGKR